jgi:hypothetical protein
MVVGGDGWLMKGIVDVHTSSVRSGLNRGSARVESVCRCIPARSLAGQRSCGPEMFRCFDFNFNFVKARLGLKALA